MSAPLPKPARVEKWQRWLDHGTEYTLSDQCDSGAHLTLCGDILSHGVMRDSKSFFLGYAKPDKVEVGQRWRSTSTNSMDFVIRCFEHGRWGVDGLDGLAAGSLGPNFLQLDVWEYLGMAESAEPQRSCGAALDVDAERVGLKRVSGETDEELRAKVVARYRGDNYGRPVSASYYTEVTDPKAEARRANEEAAKRLIANPPEWAYPKAWMCAVLAYLEESGHAPINEVAIVIACKRAHNREPEPIGAAIDDGVRDAYNAYARGIQRPSPPKGRPGVKGGISTCDLGGDYE